MPLLGGVLPCVLPLLSIAFCLLSGGSLRSVIDSYCCIVLLRYTTHPGVGLGLPVWQGVLHVPFLRIFRLDFLDRI